MIISVDSGRAFDKVQRPFMSKIIKKISIRKNMWDVKKSNT